MAQNHSHLTVKKLYSGVIDDVIAGIRDSFLDEGIDEQILQELRHIWEQKLSSQKALDHTNPTEGASATAADNGSTSTAAASNSTQKPSARQSTNPNPIPQQPQPSSVPVVRDPNTLIPIQITIPKAPHDPPGPPKTITIRVPSFCIQSNKIQEILTKPEVQAFMALPLGQAERELQQFVENFLKSDSISDPYFARTHSVISHHGQGINPNGIVQVDGQAVGDDSSDEEDEEEDDDDDLDDDLDLDKDDEKDEEEDVGQDEEPLNSEDDVSDSGDTNDKLYEVDNVVVCQYDKITRTRNKWKFHLKDGIMNLNGKDYVFQKCNGDAEW